MNRILQVLKNMRAQAESDTFPQTYQAACDHHADELEAALQADDAGAVAVVACHRVRVPGDEQLPPHRRSPWRDGSPSAETAVIVGAGKGYSVEYAYATPAGKVDAQLVADMLGELIYDDGYGEKSRGCYTVEAIKEQIAALHPEPVQGEKDRG